VRWHKPSYKYKTGEYVKMIISVKIKQCFKYKKNNFVIIFKAKNVTTKQMPLSKMILFIIKKGILIE